MRPPCRTPQPGRPIDPSEIVFRGRYMGLWQAPAVAQASAARPVGEPAGYGRRLLAFVVDAIASDLVALAFTRPPGTAYTTAVYVIFLTEIIVLTALTGHSFGQRVVGVRIV